MAYPFVPCPKYEVFLEQLSGYGVSIKTKTVDVDGKVRHPRPPSP